MKRYILSGSLVFVIIFLFSCMTTEMAPESGAISEKQKAPSSKVYQGSGKSNSLIEAISKAKMDAVKKAVVDMIGVANERANREKLEKVLYNSKNPNAFVFTDTYKTTRKDKIGDEYIIECEIAVNLNSVRSTLKANGILEGEEVTTEKETESAASESGKETAEKAKEVGPPLSGIIEKYVDSMTYMVYFNEESKENNFYMKAAVGIANEYLASHSLEAVDLEQVQKLKKDQRKVYEEETGESISIIQWIAQKLNADIYIEIDGITSGESRAGKYYGQASITLKVFEASTGRLLGSVPWNSPKTFSTSSERAARINAIQTSVYKAMPIAIQQAKAYMAKALRNGIPYEVIIQNTPDSRLMSKFRRKLKSRVKDVQTLSMSAEETRYRVYYIGYIEDLVDLIYDVAETVPGLENMEQVLLRGKSVTFDSGM